MPASPSMRRRRLAAELRKLRTQSGMKNAEVAKLLKLDPSRLSRVENRQTGVTLPELRAALDIYGVQDAGYREYLAGLARRVNERGWWQKYAGTIASDYADLISLEEEARVIRAYQQELVPGLLQTPEYARAAIRATSPGATARQIERRAEVRKERQEILTREKSPARLTVVLSEGALRRTVGGDEVMLGQLEYLMRPRDRANVSVQVLPFSAGVHPAMTGPFTMLAFRDDDDLGIVYTENATGALFLEEPDEIRVYEEIWGAIQAAALSPDDSQAFLKTISFGYRTYHA